MVGFGTDPDLQVDIIAELDLVNTTAGVTQVSGLHNASKAYLFQGKDTSSFAWGQSLGKEDLSGECSYGVCLSEDHLCYFSCVIVIRNVWKCQRCSDSRGGVFCGWEEGH